MDEVGTSAESGAVGTCGAFMTTDQKCQGGRVHCVSVQQLEEQQRWPRVTVSSGAECFYLRQTLAARCPGSPGWDHIFKALLGVAVS